MDLARHTSNQMEYLDRARMPNDKGTNDKGNPKAQMVVFFDESAGYEEG